METKEIINIIETEFKKSKLSSILNKGKSYLIEDYVQFVASCPMALPFAENYKFANKEFNKEYYDLFDSVEEWKNLKGKGYKKFLQVADNDIVVDEKITFGIDVCVTDNSINYYILTHEFKDPFFKENPLYFENEKELKFILGTVFDNLSLTESKTSARKSIKEANESVIINGKKTNFKINDYGTFFGEKIKYMLIGEPLENEDVLTDFLEENSNFEFEEYKIPYSTVYYIYNDEKSLFGVAYRHYIRLTNDEKDAKIMLAYATDKRDLYNGL